ncbi:two component AraC family transcriptional regulator [Caballeronia choica]|jgi:CheY-like chemotaxis protein|uniref:Two component AraC family transcriptional regulator n=1 Tax=Caballeronia choica TaxID=326476 RepID=A0A158KN34_9BURK|nr:response regulator [Caballeronia choica]SAL82532.1 two component AraC family transcriptional regulator [Caballeronia choica]
MSTILLVDDEPDTLYVLDLLLTAQGYRVVKARNGFEGMELGLAGPPDLVISDWVMPVMDGTQLYRCFAAIPRLTTVPFVFISAAAPPDELAVGPFLRKPFDLPLLLDLIARSLSS